MSLISLSPGRNVALSEALPITTEVRRLLREGVSQDAHDYFGTALGVSRAERLSYLWRETYDNRSAYDKLMGQGSTKEEKFRRWAGRAGYTDDEINAYLSL